MQLDMTPQRPYLLRALYDWLLDNGCTPHVVVDTTLANVEVPQEHVKDGQIVLNVHPDALTRFEMDQHHLSFEARFGGVPRRIWIPMAAILAIYARENGAGTIFEAEPGLSQAGEGDSEAELAPLESVDTPPLEDESGGTTPPPRKGRPSLKVVK